MKFKGFTLSEVLITMTIIGVVATLTMPALVSNVQRQQAGPALLRAIATLDTANAIMVTEQDMYSFDESCGNYTDCFVNFIQQRIGATSENTGITYTDLPEGIAEPSNGFITKNGFIYYFNGYDVLIDTNGIKGPNEYGKDLFSAVISPEDEGKVYALGSRVQPTNAGEWSTWDTNDNCTRNKVNDTRTCAGSIIDNGGNVIYPW